MAFGDMLEILPADEGMGNGLFATVNIPLGTRIVVEKPIISLPQSPTPFQEFCKAARLMDANMNGLSDLYCNARLLNENLPGNILAQIRSEDPQNPIDVRDDTVMNLVRMYATYYTNAAVITDDKDAGSAVFGTSSHINHSCTPNAFSNFNSENEEQTIYAGYNIRAGQQILVSYFGGNEDLMTRAQRLEQTQRDWSFACTCKVCVESDTTDSECERRGDLRKELDQLLNDWPPDGHGARQAMALEVVQKAEELLEMMDGADLGEWKLSPIYRECARYNHYLGYSSEAIKYAIKYRDTERMFYSEDEIDLEWMEETGLHIPE